MAARTQTNARAVHAPAAVQHAADNPIMPNASNGSKHVDNWRNNTANKKQANMNDTHSANSYGNLKERQMSALTGLKLVAAKRPQAAPPIVQRRNKLSNQLFQQIELARCLSEGKTYAPTRLRNIKDKLTGERRTVEAVKRVKQWWFVADTGKVCLQVRYGTRVIELAKGKNSIEVGNAAELMTVLTAVKTAVEAGDLDAQIDVASAAVRERFAQ